MKNSTKNIRNQLPTYEPPLKVWEEIDNALNLQNSIQTLPTYQPSEVVWENIVADLPTIQPKVFWLKKLSLAAAVFLLIGMIWWQQQSASSEVTISYSKELIDNNLLVADWDEEEMVLTQIEGICATQNYVCTAPEFQLLEKELQELENAKSALKEAINNFG